MSYSESDPTPGSEQAKGLGCVCTHIENWRSFVIRDVCELHSHWLLPQDLSAIQAVERFEETDDGIWSPKLRAVAGDQGA